MFQSSQSRRSISLNSFLGCLRNSSVIVFPLLVLLSCSSAAVAHDELGDPSLTLKVGLDTTWVIFSSLLVFFMNTGFAMIESGFCQSKNTVNILTKNLIVFGLSTIAYWAIGFGLMFSNGNDFIGFQGLFLTGADNSPLTGEDYAGIFRSLSWTGIPLKAKFFFQLMFAGTAATIVSGAVAERIKFSAFLLFSSLFVGFAYPITGHWIWGDGWLARLGFIDFSGSTAVHTVGGCAALVGAFLLGPRLGRYAPAQGAPQGVIPGHNLSMATLGGLILWFGWYGFNAGATMAVDANTIAHIVVSTSLSAVSGAIAAMITSWQLFKNTDLSMIINGVLSGLVSITASCAFVGMPSAVIIGAVAGTMVVFSVQFFDRLRIDDPVGAISVHLTCGIWGAIAVGIFSVGPGELYPEGAGPLAGVLFGGGANQLLIQFLGVAAVIGFTLLFSFACWMMIQITIGIRVSKEEEIDGLDISEHGMIAYSDLYNLEEKILDLSSGNPDA